MYKFVLFSRVNALIVAATLVFCVGLPPLAAKVFHLGAIDADNLRFRLVSFGIAAGLCLLLRPSWVFLGSSDQTVRPIDYRLLERGALVIAVSALTMFQIAFGTEALRALLGITAVLAVVFCVIDRVVEVAKRYFAETVPAAPKLTKYDRRQLATCHWAIPPNEQDYKKGRFLDIKIPAQR